MFNKNKIAVVGLGYVGLPLALEFSKYYDVIGFDINKKRISDLQNGEDKNNEVQKSKIAQNKVFFTSDKLKLKDCDIFIVTVPTPVNKKNIPDVRLIKQASSLVGRSIKKNSLIVFESTVYPGFTKEILIPILERNSNLKINKDFFCGYSPERINPGDKRRNLKNINKIVSGSNQFSLNLVFNLYKKIINSKVVKTKSIEIAESAKVIENCQRDLNIAFMNELFMIFSKLNLNFFEIFKAAKTKWNFLPFVPGLVGGHCIGVDPYYLAFKAKKIGHTPKIILSGRNINNAMPKFYANLIKTKINTNSKKNKILILGATFKENCKDLRNSKVFELYKELKKKGFKTDLYDPMFNFKQELINKNKIINSKPKLGYYNLIVLAVAHKKFKKMGLKKIMKWGKKECKFFDIKNFLVKNDQNFK